MNDKTPSLVRTVVTCVLLFGCGISAAQQSDDAAPKATDWKAVPIATGIQHPWGMAWLPSGEMLVSSRPGSLYTVRDGKFIEVPMEGLPDLYTEGQGGLLDISVRPGGSGDPQIYLLMSTGDADANRTTLARGTYRNGRVQNIETLFQVQPDKSGSEHFGSRMLWLGDDTFLMSVGDGGNPPRMVDGMLAREQAQNLGSHLGSILRLDRDGNAPSDNPFVGRAGAKPEIWSYGHRNIQGLTQDASGQLWATEHGPRGGDELNLVEGGQNYGWPLASYGRDYQTGEPIGEESIAGAIGPKKYWVPTSIAPSGLVVYSGPHFPEWRGDVFAGALVTKDIRRLELSDSMNVTSEESLEIGERVRDVKQGPDGYLYVLTDEEDGRLLRIEPE